MLSIDQAAELSGVSQRALQRMALRGFLPAEHFDGGWAFIARDLISVRPQRRRLRELVTRSPDAVVPIAKAAELTGVSRRVLQRRAQLGQLPAKPLPNGWQIRTAALAATLARKPPAARS